MGQVHELEMPLPRAVSVAPVHRRQWGRLAAGALLAFGLMGIAYGDSLLYLVQQWIDDDNYSYGFFIPLIVGYLIWLRREQVLASGIAPSWWGVAVAGIGAGLYLVGELATLMVVLHASFWLVLVGLALTLLGPRATRQIAFALGYLLTMFPLPQLLQQNLSSSLQLLSSTFGVGCLQLIGVTAFREGNVIDLGPIQLQVVEACSGLRYLFPLMSLALLCSYLFQDRLWKRAVLVCSAVPLAIVLNGLRIGAIGVLVDTYGRSAAEGFMHFFEGWVIFVVSLAVLYGEMMWLSRIGGTVERAPALVPATASPRTGRAASSAGPSWSAALTTVLLLLGVMAVSSVPLHGRQDVAPLRQTFLDFPMTIGGWRGTPMTMERMYVDTLRFNDYLLADYHGPAGVPVNLYVAYYRSQKAGQSAHSPKTCMPGGGWEMSDLSEVLVGDAATGRRFSVNRVVIQKGEARQVVFYWFKQRERIVTNEYLVKAWLFWDSLTRRRSDGALVRLVAPVMPGEDDSAADRRLQHFAALVQPTMADYVPD